MAYRIRWSPQAFAYFQEIVDFIAKDSDRYASFFAKRINSIIESLPRHPKSGRIVPEYGDENIRERIYRDYRIVYRLKDNFVEIVAIHHGARLLNNLF